MDSKKFVKNKLFENRKKCVNKLLIHEMYKTYLYEHKEPNNHPSIEELFEEYGLSKKGVSHRTTWQFGMIWDLIIKNRRKDGS